jgi:hypothetical protein
MIALLNQVPSKTKTRKQLRKIIFGGHLFYLCELDRIEKLCYFSISDFKISILIINKGRRVMNNSNNVNGKE